MNRKVLLVDDEPSYRASLRIFLIDLGFDALEASNGKSAISLLKSQSFDLIISDLQMPEADGYDVLRAVKDLCPHTPTLIMSGQNSVEVAVQVMKLGAKDFLQKPIEIQDLQERIQKLFGDREEIDITQYDDLELERKPNKILETQKPQPQSISVPPVPMVSLPSESLEAIDEDISFQGKHPSIGAIIQLIKKVAPSDVPILITGESGTGKELIAKLIHKYSNRIKGPWVPVNCGAIPENLLESELFGHVKGAFTGAIRTHKGRFLLANKGSIFLDEIGEMSPLLQVKLLRVLQTHTFEPVGGSEAITSDFRVVAATNRNLEQEIKTGSFREDLYYRLNVIPIEIPPLRERVSDIPILIQFFIQKFNTEKGYEVDGLTSQAIEALKLYPWPGNIRELENIVQRIVILKGHGTIEIDDIPQRIRGDKKVFVVSAPVEISPPSAEEKNAVSPDILTPEQKETLLAIHDNAGEEHLGEEHPINSLYQSMQEFQKTGKPIDFNEVINHFETELILHSLKQANGNKNQAAKFLNLKRTTLVEKIKKKNIITPADPED